MLQTNEQREREGGRVRKTNRSTRFEEIEEELSDKMWMERDTGRKRENDACREYK